MIHKAHTLRHTRTHMCLQAYQEELDRLEREERNRQQEEVKRGERKNRDMFKELLQKHKWV